MPEKKKNIKTKINSKVIKAIKTNNPLLKNSINIKIDLDDDNNKKKRKYKKRVQPQQQAQLQPYQPQQVNKKFGGTYIPSNIGNSLQEKSYDMVDRAIQKMSNLKILRNPEFPPAVPPTLPSITVAPTTAAPTYTTPVTPAPIYTTPATPGAPPMTPGAPPMTPGAPSYGRPPSTAPGFEDTIAQITFDATNELKINTVLLQEYNDVPSNGRHNIYTKYFNKYIKAHGFNKIYSSEIINSMRSISYKKFKEAHQTGTVV